jgi:hypothetical protein
MTLDKLENAVLPDVVVDGFVVVETAVMQKRKHINTRSFTNTLFYGS